MLSLAPPQARPAYGQPVPSYRPTVIVTNPILGLINSIGYKISNTAEFLAGIMTRTVQVIKGFNLRVTSNYV